MTGSVEAGQFFQSTTQPRHPYLIGGAVLLVIGLLLLCLAAVLVLDSAALPSVVGSSNALAGIGFSLLGLVVIVLGAGLAFARRRLWSSPAAHRPCPSCGESNLVVSRFCHQCGKPLSPGLPKSE